MPVYNCFDYFAHDSRNTFDPSPSRRCENVRIDNQQVCRRTQQRAAKYNLLRGSLCSLMTCLFLPFLVVISPPFTNGKQAISHRRVAFHTMTGLSRAATAGADEVSALPAWRLSPVRVVCWLVA